MLESKEIRDFVSFQINRHVKNLYKKYIVITEDLQQEHREFSEKIEGATSDAFIKNIDYFNEKKYNYIRKKILDAGNEAIRDIEKILSVLSLSIDSEKIEELKLSDLTKSVKFEGGLNNKKIRVKGKLI